MQDLHWINRAVKQLRAHTVAKHLKALGERRVVCFTCGLAAEELRKAGLQVVAVGPGQELVPTRWYTYSQIAAQFRAFDATSGHLPLPLMAEMAAVIATRWPKWQWDTRIPCGSGETFVLLCMAYPGVRFTPVDDGTPATQRHAEAPLNALVAALS